MDLFLVWVWGIPVVLVGVALLAGFRDDWDLLPPMVFMAAIWPAAILLAMLFGVLCIPYFAGKALRSALD